MKRSSIFVLFSGRSLKIYPKALNREVSEAFLDSFFCFGDRFLLFYAICSPFMMIKFRVSTAIYSRSLKMADLCYFFINVISFPSILYVSRLVEAKTSITS